MPCLIGGCKYPTNAEFLSLQMELMPKLMENRLGLNVLPLKTSEFSEIIFNQPDSFKGLQQWRGLGQPTQAVDHRYNPYGRLCSLPPGYWGEFDEVPEEFLTKAAQPGTCADTLDITEYMTTLMQRLTERQLNRIESNIWNALTYGRYEALNSSGQVTFSATFNIQTVTAATSWADIVNARPLDDFRTIQLLGRGTSADFGLSATAYMNRVTANCLFRNQNPNDVGKAGLSACCTFMGPDVVNAQFAAQGLPQIKIYDDGYLDKNNQFQPFIPDGYVVIVGVRPGNTPVGHYWLTRNTVDCAVSTGFWAKTVDNCNWAVPRDIKLHMGHNGGAAIEYPRSVIVLQTGC